MLRVLAVSPHPDDVEIGCGGTIARLAMAPSTAVDLLVFTGPGDLTMVHSASTVTFEQRQEEQARAAAVLGIGHTIWAKVAPASKFDTVPQADFVSVFDKLLPAYDAMLIPLPSYNKDHRIVWESAMAAIRPGKADAMTVYAYEQHASQLQGAWGAQLEMGKVYRPLTLKHMELKHEAILCHTSQMEGRAETIYGIKGADISAVYRGLECDAQWAELLYLVRKKSATHASFV